MASPPTADRAADTWLASLGTGLRGAMLVPSLAVAMLAVLSVRAPSAAEMQQSASPFSTERAMRTVAQIAVAPHPVGSAEHRRVQALIRGVLEDLDLETRTLVSTSCTELAGQVRCAQVTNLVARLPGTGNGDAIVLDTHTDSADHSPGAGDNGAAVAVALEVARILKAAPPLANDVLFLFSDAEEEALLGTSAFVHDPLFKRVKLAINLDARGTSGPSMMFETSPGNRHLVRALAASSPRPVSSSLMFAASRVMPNGTNATAYILAGVPTLSFAFVGSVQNYHHLTDSIENLAPASLYHHGSQTLALIQHVGNATLDDLKTDDNEVFFDVMGGTVVQYPEWLAACLTLIAVMLLLFLARGAQRQRMLTWRILLQAHGALWLATAASFAAVLAAHKCVQWALAGQPGIAYAPVLHAGFVLLALGVSLGVYARAQRSVGLVALQLGALGAVAIAAVLTAALLPGASPLFVWPLLFICGALLAAHALPNTNAKAAALCLIPVPGVIPVAEALGLGMDIQQAQAPVVIVLPLVWAVGALLPLASVLMSARALLVNFTVAVLCLTTAVVLAPTDDHTPRESVVSYGLHAKAGTARWVVSTGDPWAQTFLLEDAQRSALPWLTPLPHELHHAAAPVLPLAPPTLEVGGHEVVGNLQVWTVHVRSPRGARCVRVWGGPDVEVFDVMAGEHRPGRVSAYSPELEKRWWGFFFGAPPRVSFSLRYCGLPADGASFTFATEPDKHPVLHVVDESDGLPESLHLPLRPKPWVPGLGSDVTQVANTFAL